MLDHIHIQTHTHTYTHARTHAALTGRMRSVHDDKRVQVVLGRRVNYIVNCLISPLLILVDQIDLGVHQPCVFALSQIAPNPDVCVVEVGCIV